MWEQLPSQDGNNVIAYVDEILITATSREECTDHTRTVLEIISQTGFKMNPTKAQLVRQTVKYLGLDLNPDGRSPDMQWVELPATIDASTLHSSLGLVGFLHGFIEDFHWVAAPLCILLKGHSIEVG